MNQNNIQIASNLYDIDMERAILSSIFYNEDSFSEVFDLIKAEDFYLKGHFDIYCAMVECVNKDEPIDFAFVKKRLDGRYDEVVFTEIIATNSLIDVKKYANELKEKSVKRALISIAHKIPAKINENEYCKDTVDQISAEIYALVDDAQTGKIKETPQIIKEVVLEIKKQKEVANKDLVGLDTGFRYLNEYTKGFKEGELIIIAARPGMGKTAFVLNVISKTLNLNKGVAFFSLEMPSTQLMMRMLSAKTSIPLSNIMTAKMEDDEISRFSDACNDMVDRKLFVYDSGYVNIHQVRTQLRKLKAAHEDISLCVIDYIGLMTSSGSYSERHLQIAEISRGLKLLARELNMPIIALSQLNRGLESRSNKRPMLSDLRESGAIEQDADTILFVYRNDFYAEQEEKEKEERARNEGRDYDRKFIPNANEEKAEIIIGKNRNGALGTIEVMFQKQFTRFVDNSFMPTHSVEFKE